MYDSPRSSTNCGLLFVRRVYAYSARETITLTTAIPSPESNRSEEHTSELQSPCNLVCRLLLEKKKKYQSFTESEARLRFIISVYCVSSSLDCFSYAAAALSSFCVLLSSACSQAITPCS